MHRMLRLVLPMVPVLPPNMMICTGAIWKVRRLPMLSNCSRLVCPLPFLNRWSLCANDTFLHQTIARLYIFRADTDELRNNFVDVIRKDLQASMSEQLWQDKCDAMKE